MILAKLGNYHPILDFSANWYLFWYRKLNSVLCREKALLFLGRLPALCICLNKSKVNGDKCMVNQG